MPQHVGVIGLGNMGAPMAWNIRKAGYPLVVHNRTVDKVRPFQQADILAVSTPSDLAAACDLVVIMVSDSNALLEVIQGGRGVAVGVKRGTTVINMSTVSADATELVAHAIRDRGAYFIDAPVSGSVNDAEERQLVVLASGPLEWVEAVMPLFRAMSKEVIYCGDTGQGTRMNLVLSLLFGGMTTLLAEALVLARQFGLDERRLLKAIADGPTGAPLYRTTGKAMVERNYAKQLSVALMCKDLDLLVKSAGKVHAPLAVGTAAAQLFASAREQGLGEQDIAAVVQAIEKGLPP